MPATSDATPPSEGIDFEGTFSAPLSAESRHSLLFSTAFDGFGLEQTLLMPWSARAVAVQAQPLPAQHGMELLQNLWAHDKYMSHLDAGAIDHLAPFFEFATVSANQDVIAQDEYGNFMVVLLSGNMAVDRVQPWGERLRLAEAWPGEILGEMSLLDSGIRFSTCTTMDVCELAILNAQGMDDMMNAQPLLAAKLIALLARKLSLRLRVVSARLSDTRAAPSAPPDTTRQDEVPPLFIQGSE
jgi:CRP/FNR family transcriptional regulator, cyclic AMP receptor protein